MDMEKFMELLAQSPEFIELVHKTRQQVEASGEPATATAGHQVRRVKMMEPLRDEGEWLLTSEPAGDD